MNPSLDAIYAIPGVEPLFDLSPALRAQPTAIALGFREYGDRDRLSAPG